MKILAEIIQKQTVIQQLVGDVRFANARIYQPNDGDYPDDDPNGDALYLLVNMHTGAGRNLTPLSDKLAAVLGCRVVLGAIENYEPQKQRELMQFSRELTDISGIQDLFEIQKLSELEFTDFDPSALSGDQLKVHQEQVQTYDEMVIRYKTAQQNTAAQHQEAQVANQLHDVIQKLNQMTAEELQRFVHNVGSDEVSRFNHIFQQAIQQQLVK